MDGGRRSDGHALSRRGVSLRRGTLMAVLAHGRPLLTTEPQVATPNGAWREDLADFGRKYA